MTKLSSMARNCQSTTRSRLWTIWIPFISDLEPCCSSSMLYNLESARLWEKKLWPKPMIRRMATLCLRRRSIFLFSQDLLIQDLLTISHKVSYARTTPMKKSKKISMLSILIRLKTRLRRLNRKREQHSPKWSKIKKERRLKRSSWRSNKKRKRRVRL